MDAERERPAAPDGADQRGDGIVVDLERLQEQAEHLYLHRFVDAVRQARDDHGRYLILRAGDEIAIRSATDGSAEALTEITVEPEDDE